MKRLVLLFCFLMTASATFAAHAALFQLLDVGAYTDPPSPTVIRWTFSAIYQGSDVPGAIQKTILSVSVSSTTTPAQLQSTIVTAIQNEATNRGFTVPSGGTLIPSFTAQ